VHVKHNTLIYIRKDVPKSWAKTASGGASLFNLLGVQTLDLDLIDFSLEMA